MECASHTALAACLSTRARSCLARHRCCWCCWQQVAVWRNLWPCRSSRGAITPSECACTLAMQATDQVRPCVWYCVLCAGAWSMEHAAMHCDHAVMRMCMHVYAGASHNPVACAYAHIPNRSHNLDHESCRTTADCVAMPAPLHATSLLSALSHAAHPSRRCTSSTCANCCATASRSYLKPRHALPHACASQGRQQQPWSGHQPHVETESSASHPSVPTLK
jgi:hypothetical protein